MSGNGDNVDVLSLLSVAYGGSKEERTAATSQLEAAFASVNAPQYLVRLVKAGMNSTLPPEQSLSALIYAKNCLLHTVPDEVLAGSPGLLQELERLLFQAVFVVPESHRRIICTMAMTLISGFAWSFLGELMPMIIAESNTLKGQFAAAAANPGGVPRPGPDAAEHSLASLQLLHTYTQRFKTPGLEPMEMKLEVSSALVEVLPVYLGFSDFRVSRYVFKVMECVVENALQVSKEREMPANALDEWFALMAAFPEQNYQAAFAAGGKTYEEYVGCVKRVAMIAYSVMNDATRRKKCAPVAQHFLKAKLAHRFLDVWRQWLQSCVAAYASKAAGGAGDLPSLHKDSEMFAMRFLKMCTLDEALFKEHLRPQALALIEHLLFPYLCYGEEDDEIFTDDDNLSEYVQYMMDEGFGNGELSPRQAASNTILSLIGGKKAFHDANTLLQEVLQVLTTGLSLETNADNFPRLFGFLQLLSILRKYLRQIPDIWTGQMAQVLMRFVAPRLQPDVPFIALRCKAVVVCQRFSKVPMPSEQDFASFLQMMCALVQDKDVRIRLAGVDAMCTLLEMRRARPYLKPILVPLVEECMGFLNRVQTTFVPTVILHLTTHFAPELTPVMGRLGGVLVQHFLATAFDLQQMEVDFSGEEADITRFDHAAVSADSLLEAILTVVLSSSENKEAFLAMRPDMIRLVRTVLSNPESFDFMDNTLAIYLHVVNFSGAEIPVELWDLLPLLFQSIDSGVGVDFFAMIEEVLDNYISGATVQYMTNAELMEATLSACSKMLVGGVVCDASCHIASCQLFDAMLHQAKGCAEQPGLMDAYLPRVVALLLQALVHPDIVAAAEVRIRIWVIAALMDCFFYNAPLTLDVMLRMGAYPQFFDGFFHFFRGCLPQFEQEMDANAPAAAVAGKKGTKRQGTKKRSPEEEAQRVVEELSILTRKVIVLGLSSLLSYLLSPSAPASPQVAQCREAFVAAQHEAKAVALVQHCLFENEEKYAARCKLSEENIAKIRAGEAGEDDVDDVDLGEEEILGLDGGDDTAGLAGDDAADGAYEDLSEVDDWDDAGAAGGGVPGAAPDEGDDYESPIDDINEVHAFTQWLTTLSQLPAPVQEQAMAYLRPEADYVRAGQVAGRYRELCKELEAVMEEDYRHRSALASQ